MRASFAGVVSPPVVEEEIDYDEPREQSIYITVTPRKGHEFEPVEAHEDGIFVRHKSTKPVAQVARWPAVMLALRWALKRSKQMRADVRAMLDDIDPALPTKPDGVPRKGDRIRLPLAEQARPDTVQDMLGDATIVEVSYIIRAKFDRTGRTEGFFPYESFELAAGGGK